MPEIAPPVDSGAGTGTPPAGDQPKPPEAPKKLEFTQEEFDRIIADRARRAVPADYEELKALKAKQDEAAEAEKTELQREKDARKEAEKASKAREAQANAKLIRAEILTEAAAQNASDTDIVVALLSGNADITVDDEGNVQGAKAAVKDLLKSKPILVKGAPPSSGGEFGGNDPKTRNARVAELEARMNDPKLSMSERQAAGREARSLKVGSIIA
jgi:hypothetical protein